MSEETKPRKGVLTRFREYLLGETTFKQIDADSGKGLFAWDRGEQPKGVKAFYTWYEIDGVVFAGINSLSDEAVGQGYHNVVDDMPEEDPNTGIMPEMPQEKQLVDDLGEHLNLDGLHWNICANMLIAGYCCVEYKSNKLPTKAAAKIIHPSTIKTIIRGTKYWHGVDSIIQKVKDKEVTIKGKDLVWYDHRSLGNSKLGTSTIRPVQGLLGTKTTAIDNMDRIIERYLSPLIIWKTTRDIAPIQEMVEQHEAGEDLFLGNLTGDEMELVAQVVEVRGDSKFWEYIQYIDILIYKGIYAPDLYYWKDATLASAKELTAMVDRNINNIQRTMARGTEMGFYRPLIESNSYEEVPRIKWGVEKTGAEDLQMDGVLSTAIEVGMLGPEHMTRLLKMMGLNLGDLGWDTGGEPPAVGPRKDDAPPDDDDEPEGDDEK